MRGIPRHGVRGARRAAPRASASSSGFTLIEMLAVIVILGILMIVLLPRLTGMSERAKAKMTGTFLQEVATAIGEYERRFGDYPPSQFVEKWGTPPNTTNLGGETLVVSLWSLDWGGTSLSEDKFVNTDKDELKKSLTRFPTNALTELKDEWGNPIAYFHRRDYGRTDTYVATEVESGEEREMQVKALTNPTTKTYFESNKFQLISAGEDGIFGTDDDVTNFKRE